MQQLFSFLFTIIFWSIVTYTVNTTDNTIDKTPRSFAQTGWIGVMALVFWRAGSGNTAIETADRQVPGYDTGSDWNKNYTLQSASSNNINGVWSVRSMTSNRRNRVTVHFVRWSGEELMGIIFVDYHPLKRVVPFGIVLHEGVLFACQI